jgi:MoaA/NifB/PqqE/SkfB family radical SAM enzyme
MVEFGKTKNNESERQIWLKAHKPHVYDKVIKYPEKLARGESVGIIQFQYNYMCNFRCEHCSIDKFKQTPIEEKNRRIFQLEDIRELSRQADELGLAHFVITGGEPLIFPDFDKVVEAIDPSKFFLVSDSNGWFLDYEKAKHLKSIGLDKIQLSLDGADAQSHDKFRNKPGSWQRCVNAIDACQKAGLHLILSTVVWKDRVHSQELIDFLEFAKQKEVGTYISYAKPVGAYEGKFDCLIDEEDEKYIASLESKYDVFTHLTPSYGMDIGCIAVKRMISITRYGDIMPCPYMHISLGSFFEEPLKDIIARGMSNEWFGLNKKRGCIMTSDKDFVYNIVTKTYKDQVPVSYKEIFTQ